LPLGVFALNSERNLSFVVVFESENEYIGFMKHGGTMLVWLAGSLALCAAATARATDAPDNPYQAVVERNVFGLKPPPPPPDPEANKPPLPKITLTGIITVGGAKRVLLKTPPPQPKPGEPPKTEQGFILAVGEREGEIEVLEIDEKAGSVKVNYGGTVADLTFEKDGVKGPATPAPGALPAPGVPPPMRTLPPGARGGPGMGASPIPGRWPRTPGEGGPVTPQAAAGAVLPGMNAGANPSVTPQSTAAQGFGSEEEAVLLLEVNRIKNQPLVEAGLMPPLPRHELSGAVQSLLTDPAPAATPAAAPVTLPPLPPGGAQQFPPQAPQ
jgi:hypothetical protein